MGRVFIILSLRDDKVYEPPGDHDHLLDGLAIKKRFGLFGGLGGGFKVGLRDAGRDLDHIAELSIHLHGNFERILDEQGRVEVRPGGVGQGGGRCAEGGIELGP